MFWTIVIILIVIFIIVGVNGQKKEKEIKDNYRSSGFDLDKLVKLGTYVGGHPDKNENADNCHVFKSGEILEFYRKVIAEKPVKLFSIKNESIKAITVEDATTMEKKVTLGRVLLVGIFALAWKKKKKNEIAFVVIDWSDGRFDNATTFSFEGKVAMQQANTARNELIRMCK